MDNNNRPEIRLLPAHGKRLKRGHPWLYSNEIRMDDAARALTPGALVEIIGTDGRGLGVAMFNRHHLIGLDRDPWAPFPARRLGPDLGLLGFTQSKVKRAPLAAGMTAADGYFPALYMLTRLHFDPATNGL